MALAFASAGCSARSFRHDPQPSELPRPETVNEIPIRLGLFEEIEVLNDISEIGGAPSYLEPLARKLRALGLVTDIVTTERQPPATDVGVQMIDTVRVNLHPGLTQMKRWSTILLLMLPAPILEYEASVDSDLLLRTTTAGDALPPVGVRLRAHTELRGKFGDLFGGEDARETLAMMHSEYVAGLIADELVSRREWLKGAAMTSGDSATPPEDVAEGPPE